MIKLYIMLSFLVWNLSSYSQTSKWEVYAGPNHSNVKHIRFGQQITLNHTLNAPKWNYGYQFGINRSIWRAKNYSSDFSLGIKYQLKGDKLSFHEVLPRDTIYGIKFQYLMMPLNYKFQLIKTKQIYFKQSISLGYLIHKQELNENGQVLFLWVDSFSEKLELSYSLGFDFSVANNVLLEIMYSEGLTNIATAPVAPFPDEFVKYRNQAFEFSLIWKL